MLMNTYWSFYECSIAGYIDMPTINEKYRFQHYCKVYGIVLKKDNITLSKISIAKKDLCGNIEEDAEWFEEGHYPVELGLWQHLVGKMRMMDIYWFLF